MIIKITRFPCIVHLIVSHSSENRYKRDIKNILEIIHNQNQVLVLLLDEFDSIFEKNDNKDEILIFHKGFQYFKDDVGECLSMIMTASKSLDKFLPENMDDYLGIPCLDLTTFEDSEVVLLWNEMPTSLKEKEELRKMIQKITGGYPALIQRLCYHLYNQFKDLNGGQTLTKEFINKLESDFNKYARNILQYIWFSLDDTEKMLLMLIALYNLGGKIDDRRYDVNDAGKIFTDSAYKSKIEDLKARGIIFFNSVELEKNVKQQKEVYYFTASSMQEWVIREIAGNSQTQVAERERIFLIMTKGQLNTQFSNIKNAMNFIGENFGTIKSLAGGISTILGV